MHARVTSAGLKAPSSETQSSVSASQDDDFGWRDVAFYIARETNTPAPTVMTYDLIEVHRWLAVIQRHGARERKQFEQTQT